MCELNKSFGSIALAIKGEKREGEGMVIPIFHADLTPLV
jgi:hypothetical protein